MGCLLHIQISPAETDTSMIYRIFSFRILYCFLHEKLLTLILSCLLMFKIQRLQALHIIAHLLNSICHQQDSC